MADHAFDIDLETVQLAVVPKTVGELRAAFPDRFGDRHIWLKEYQPKQHLVALTDEHLTAGFPGYFQLYTSRPEAVKAPAGDPTLLVAPFEAGTRFETTRGIATASWPTRTGFMGKGRVVACDPYLVSGARPFDRPLPKRQFYLFIACARFEDARIGLRNTCAALIDWSARKQIVRWARAVPEGGPADWRYGVDYGVGCFINEKVAAGLARGGPRYDKLTRQLSDRMELVTEVSLGSTIVTAFNTGLGDGSYPTYWGLDAEEKVIALVTDFGILAN